MSRNRLPYRFLCASLVKIVLLSDGPINIRTPSYLMKMSVRSTDVFPTKPQYKSALFRTMDDRIENMNPNSYSY